MLLFPYPNLYATNVVSYSQVISTEYTIESRLEYGLENGMNKTGWHY